MRNHLDDLLTIRPAGLTRRSSLLALAGVTLTAAPRPGPAAAGKARSKARKRCRRQVGQCASALAPACADSQIAVSEEECLALLLPCCQEFGDCQADEAFACLFAASEAMAPPPP